MDTVTSSFKKIIIASAVGLLAVIVFGLLWLFFLSPTHPAGFGWYLFAFATGLSMIVLPCTLPLAFVIVPLSMGKGLRRGLSIALSFGAGVAVMLSIYGIAAALIGRAAVGQLGAPLETVKNWVYFIAGTFAYLFALNEIGLIKFKMPTYTGAAPAFIQKQGEYIKAFLLGMFLGNVGVGCPHPATPLLLIEIASSGDVAYGWTLFFTHAIGRILPLIFLAVLAIIGINGLNWLLTKKDKIEKATGWAMVFVAGFILTLGLFSHAWWVSSGTHTLLEKVTQEDRFLGILNEKLETEVVHSHGTEELVGHTGLFGLPLELGHWVLVALWIFPIWWWWRRERGRIDAIPSDKQISEKEAEDKLWHMKEKLFTVISVLLVAVFIWALPQWFLKTVTEREAAEHASVSGITADHTHAPGTLADHAHDTDATADHDQDMVMNEEMMHMHEDGSMHDHSEMMKGMMEMEEMMGHDPATGYQEEVDIKEGLVVSMKKEPSFPKAGESVTMTFLVQTRPDNEPYDNLVIEHEKYIHVIGVRDDLDQFFHIHPQKVSAGVWSVPHIFGEAGTYKVYVDVTDASGAHSFGQKEFTVSSGQSQFSQRTATKIEYMKNVIVGDYQVALEHDEPLVAGNTVKVRLTVRDVYGRGVELDNFLGVPMHLAVIGQDLTQYLHTHPADAAAHDSGVIDESKPHTHSLISVKKALAHVETGGPEIDSEPATFLVPFEKPGIYRMFAQFRPKGVNLPTNEAITAAFFVSVESDIGQAITKVPPIVHADTPLKVNVGPTGQKVILVIISIILMALLARFVYKKIQV
ncbi:MAG: cytochrome c biogenesis protein CcdA [bacterium]|nr:cytochrome c biogenesis protein CcdA [bacterium]